MDAQELKNIIEAAVLTSDTPVTLEQIRSLFPKNEPIASNQIQDALHELEQECAGRGIELKKIDRSYRYQSRPEYAEYLKKLLELRPRRYSRALLETLSIIAFRQPVTRGDIESIRGVSVSSEIMRTLLTNEWIEQAGHKQVPGRPALFATTAKFLEYFNLESLSALPALDLLERQSAQSASETEDDGAAEMSDLLALNEQADDTNP